MYASYFLGTGAGDPRLTLANYRSNYFTKVAKAPHNSIHIVHRTKKFNML